MTIELYFSNQLDQLADKFSDVVTDEVRGKDNILEAPVVIVPNANLAKWLQLVLAEKNSIFMNVAFQYLEAGLWEMLAALDPGENKPDMMDNDQLKILLLHILQNLDRSDADFLPMTQYLFGEDDAGRPDDAARLWQLSEKIAHLFKEYEFHRTDMIRKWAAATTETEGMERCQQRLYARLKILRDELASRTGQTAAFNDGICRSCAFQLPEGRKEGRRSSKCPFFRPFSDIQLSLNAYRQAAGRIIRSTSTP